MGAAGGDVVDDGVSVKDGAFVEWVFCDGCCLVGEVGGGDDIGGFLMDGVAGAVVGDCFGDEWFDGFPGEGWDGGWVVFLHGVVNIFLCVVTHISMPLNPAPDFHQSPWTRIR